MLRTSARIEDKPEHSKPEHSKLLRSFIVFIKTMNERNNFQVRQMFPSGTVSYTSIGTSRETRRVKSLISTSISYVVPSLRQSPRIYTQHASRTSTYAMRAVCTFEASGVIMAQQLKDISRCNIISHPVSMLINLAVVCVGVHTHVTYA